MINEMILDDNKKQLDFIAQLKKDSDYYPRILFRNQPANKTGYKSIYVSTLVRIYRHGQWYAIHCVESAMNIPSKTNWRESLLLIIMHSVHKIQQLYKVNKGDLKEMDTIQMDESKRISTYYL